MKRIVIKRIVSVLLAIGLINTQFVFGSSELSVWEQKNQEFYDTVILESKDESDLMKEGGLESEKESDNEYEIDNNGAPTYMELDLNENNGRNE